MADIESDDELCGDRHMPVRLRGLVAAAEIAGSAPDGSSSDRNEFGFAITSHPCRQFVNCAKNRDR